MLTVHLLPAVRRSLLLSVLALALAASPAPAHEGATGDAAEHAAEDAVSHTAAEERVLSQRSAAATADDAQAAAAAVEGSPAQVGQWGQLSNWPVVGVHTAVMPDGRVLSYDSVGDAATEKFPVHDHTRATLWDPATDTHTDVRVDQHNIFCSGLAHLMDGTLLAAGGNKDSQLNGIVQTHLFSAATSSWSKGKDMAYERWYPTVTRMSDGEMLITAGRLDGSDIPEVRELDGDIRKLTGASTPYIEDYPWMDVAPNGLTYQTGPGDVMRTIDAKGAGAWSERWTRDGKDRDYGSRALYDVGKLLIAGGGRPAISDSRIVDLNVPTPTTRPAVTQVGSMQHERRQHNLTVLPDGSVLATGGFSGDSQNVDLTRGVYEAERFDPATKQWTTLAAEKRARQYHSTALLLPDGRVLSAGGGLCGECDSEGYLEKNAEVYSPPYLFGADGKPALRPVIAAAPRTARYGAPLEIATADPSSIAKVALIAIGAVTHSVNMEQRYVPLPFQAGDGVLRATGPVNANVAPPGVYMLVVMNKAGVPSVARMVNVLPGAAPTVALTQPAAGATLTAPASVPLAASASGGVTKVEFFAGATKVAEDTTAPFAATWAGVPAGSYAITARATDGEGAEARSAQQTVSVASAPAPPAPPVPPKGGVLGTTTNGGTTPVGPTSPTTRVTLRDLRIVGTTTRTRTLRFTLSRAATVRVSLARRVKGRWVAVSGRRSARLRAGGVRISLREPWSGRRLAGGRYRVKVQVGSRVTYRTFVKR